MFLLRNGTQDAHFFKGSAIEEVVMIWEVWLDLAWLGGEDTKSISFS